MINFKNKIVLVTGGTGSFGQHLVEFLLKLKNKPKKIIIYSRDELKQYEMFNNFNLKFKNNNLRFFIGDVRDLPRLKMASRESNILIHAAALKHVPIAEYNPFECIKTNIIGSQNIIEAALENKISNVVALSTDKACSPVNLYGATKLCMEKLFISANNLVGDRNIKFCVVRYGNVMNSRGSVLPIFNKTTKENYFNITNIKMTRFNINLNEAISLVLCAIKNQKGGEIFIPKLKSFKILDLAKAINSKAKINITGVREGEKIYEELISKDEVRNAYDFKSFYLIMSSHVKNKYKGIKLKTILNKNSYNSENNLNYLSIGDLRKLTKNLI